MMSLAEEFEKVGGNGSQVRELSGKLTAANERIRELEAENQLAWNTCSDAQNYYTAEREVSDKLATALQRIAKLRIVEADEIIDDYVDLITEVAALRAAITKHDTQPTKKGSN